MVYQARDILWSVDPFSCESLSLKSHGVIVVTDQYTRRIIGFAVHAVNVDGPTLCRMFNEATCGQGWPRYLSSDNDPLIQYQRWAAQVRVLEMEKITSLPQVPMSHPFVECLISSVRRELLDQTFLWTATDLENKLRDHQGCHNKRRTHSGCNGATPVDSGSEKIVALKDYSELAPGARPARIIGLGMTTSYMATTVEDMCDGFGFVPCDDVSPCGQKLMRPPNGGISTDLPGVRYSPLTCRHDFSL